MKKIKYIIYLILPLLLLSCSFTEERIFGDEDNDRIDEALQDYLHVLTNAKNGWLFEYYPEDTKYGGFNLYLSFTEEGKVNITGESPILKSENELVSSWFKLKSDMGPVLSFDTYNRVIHQFSDPEPDGLGYQGDYEFIILDVSEDKIQLKGKKRGIKMTMTQFPEDKEWKTYKAELDSVIKYHPGFTMELNINGTEIPLEESAELGRYLSSSNTQNLGGLPYIYTPSGIKLKEPLHYADQVIQDFVQSEDKSKLICTNENTNALINHTPLNNAFVNKKGDWFFNRDKFGPRFTLLWDKIVQDLDERGGEELLFVLFRSPRQYLTLISYVYEERNAFDANFYMKFTPLTREEAMEDEYDGEEGKMVRILFEGGGDQFATLIYYTYFRTFLLYMSDEAPYELRYDNLKIPNEISFRRLDNPENIWFTLSK